MRKHINKIAGIAAIVGVLVFILGSGNMAFAQGSIGGNQSNSGSSVGGSQPSTNIGIDNPLKFNSVGALIKVSMEYFSYLVILFAVLALIYVGLQFVLAQGKPDKMRELKSWLGWIVVGVAIVIGARILVNVVINTLEATGTVSPGVINSAKQTL